MGKKAVIGITPGLSYEKHKLYLHREYTDGIIAAGGVPILLPVTREEDTVLEALSLCNGILLPGGPDVDARFFGEMNLHCNGAISPHRDFLEMFTAKWAVEKGIPLLGICRGVQILNVALGGSLYQDIFSQITASPVLKHSQLAPDWYPVHDVDVKPGSRLGEIFGKSRMAVNSYHHQAVKEPGAGLEAVAWSGDGVIEAVELKGQPFTLGIQWHPEMMWSEHREQLKLFDRLVEAAGGRSGI